jgi:5S rRNA maturation endonuclease (ribonuclease M5)
MENSLIQYVINHIDPKQYYITVFPSAKWGASNEARVLSPFITEKVPSFSINGETGAWYSFSASDQHGGKSIVSFYAEINQVTSIEAAKELFHKFIHPLIDEKIIRRYARKLQQTPSIYRYIKSRLITDKIIQEYRIGWDGNRITFPIQNQFGLYVNIKLYDPTVKKGSKNPKMLHYTFENESRSYGSPPVLFPFSSFAIDSKQIVICEGEWDTLNLLSLNIPAITTTGGAKSWPQDYNEYFRDKEVIIAYDNDESGKEGKNKVFKQLINVAKMISAIEIPSKYGKDINDYFRKNQHIQQSAWRRLLKSAEILVDNPESLISKGEAELVSLDQASQAKYYHKIIKLDALITGKDISPYLLPKKFRLSCTGEDCKGCHVAESASGFKDYEIKYDETSILGMLDSSESAVHRKLLNIAHVPDENSCRAKITILESFNVENILVIPTLDSQSKQYVMRSVYYMGHGLKTNKAYRFEGVSLPHPKDQHATCLFNNAKPVQDEVESFELNEQLAKKLTRFRPKNLNLLAHLMSIAEWQSRNITKIHERPDLHIAVDLAFHSVQSFTFNKEFINRGMLDVLILGDTRCGKGFVTTGLNKHYKVGEIASGDNCSFAGLVGGLQQAGTRWLITWGLIPLNNNRIVIIDEASSLTEKDISRMSRIRSEGVAEISKIIRESTQANTRLIWLANPRSGQPLLSYNTGVEAIPELIGAIEDISRFDFVLTVANNEVPSDIINATADYSTSDANKYSSEICQALILWIWSRTSEQIIFTDDATKLVISESIQFGNVYSSRIPLVQVENIRIKLAKIAAAIAARTFSTDEKYQKLIVEKAHVKCACQFLRMIYSKQSMAYDTYSTTAITASIIEDINAVGKVFDNLGDFRDVVLSGLTDMGHVTSDSLADYTSDLIGAKLLISELVKMRCLYRTEGNNYYTKNIAFNQWLREKKLKITQVRRDKNGHRTVNQIS